MDMAMKLCTRCQSINEQRVTYCWFCEGVAFTEWAGSARAIVSSTILACGRPITALEVEGLACLAALKIDAEPRLRFLQEYNRMKEDPAVLEWLRQQIATGRKLREMGLPEGGQHGITE